MLCEPQPFPSLSKRLPVDQRGKGSTRTLPLPVWTKPFMFFMCYELDVTKQRLTHIWLDEITPPLILCEWFMLPRLQVVIVVEVLLIHHPGSWGHDDDKGPWVGNFFCVCPGSNQTEQETNKGAATTMNSNNEPGSITFKRPVPSACQLSIWFCAYLINGMAGLSFKWLT